MQRRRSNPYGPSDSNNSGSNRNSNRTTASTSANAGIELRERPSSTASYAAVATATGRRPLIPPSSSVPASHQGSYAAPSSHPAPRVPFSDTPLIMKPLVGAVQAWSCVVISTFAIIILSILGILYHKNHHELVGGIDDPEDGPEVAGTIFVAVLIYAGFLVFCGLQGVMHLRENRRGAIALQ